MASKFRTWTKGDKSMSVEWLTARDILSTPDRYNAVSMTKGPPARTSVGNGASTYALVLPISSTGDGIPRGGRHKHSNSLGLQVPQQRSRANTAPSSPRLFGGSDKLVELPGSEPLLTHSTQPGTRLLVDGCQSSARDALDGDTSHSRSGHDGSRPSIHDCVSPLVDDTASPGIVPDAMAQMLATRLHDTITPLPCARSTIQPAHLPYPIDDEVRDSTLQQSSYTANMSPDASVCSPEELVRADGASVLWQQLANLRHSHEVHLLSLKDAHMKELAGHLSYISFLETRSHITTAAITRLHNHEDQAAPMLRIDTSQRHVPICELPAHEISTLKRSSRENSPQQTSVFLNPASEIESLKRQLSTARREQVEAIQLSLQYRQVKKECKQRHQENQELLAESKKLQNTTQTLRTTIANLEAQLVSANNERIDVLEGYHDACAQITALSQSKVDGLVRDQHSSRVSSGTQTIGDDPLGLVADKSTTDSSDTSGREVDDVMLITSLQDELADKDAVLRRTEADRENLQTLLLEEVRRQARQSHGHQRGTSPSIDMQADVRLQGIVADAAFAADEPGAPAAGKKRTLSDLLERELESLLRQNIMQKVELKAVRKELKHARADLSALQIITTPRPPTPEDSVHDNASTTPGTRIRLHTRGSSQNGLNISMANPPAVSSDQDRPGRPLRPASTQSLTSTKSPHRRSKARVEYNKDLPEPPRTKDKGNSAETWNQQCSPSESIYAFYAGEQISSRIGDVASIDGMSIVRSRTQRVTV